MDMLRVTANWSGFTGAPGYSNFYFAGGGGLISDATQVAERVADAIGDLGPVLPDGVEIRIQNEVAVLDSDTGMVASYEPVEGIGVTGGSGGPRYSAASGAVVTWNTGDVRFGRRIRGRTFIVPLETGAYDEDGTLTTLARASLNNFADTMRGGDLDSEFGVWSRPREGSGGVFATVNGHRVPDMVAVLRSRRD